MRVLRNRTSASVVGRSEAVDPVITKSRSSYPNQARQGVRSDRRDLASFCHNLMASAAGYVGCHLAYLAMSLDRAFERAVNDKV